jgi:formate/nitrite transporter FocA (FNT family)
MMTAQQEQEDAQVKEQQVLEEAEERSAPSGKVVYHAILSEGEEELSRPSSALFWSGLAAGLSMGFSMIAQGLLKAHLPEARWSALVHSFGYSVGFLIVILGRQQLFTENTLTPILPLLKHKKIQVLANVARLWAVVLIANLIGALAIGFVAVRSNAFSHDVRRAFVEMGHAAMSPGPGTILLRGIFAGWLIALMVWLLPYAEVGRVWVIIIITYLVGLGHFSHIIAGAVEVFALSAAGEKPWLSVICGYLLPTLIGNIIGGVTLVAALNHAQIVAGAESE